MPSIKLRDGRGGGARMASSTLSNELIVLAIGSAVEAAENGNDVDVTINHDNIEVFVNAADATE